MNKVNDYETLLELANKDLKKYDLEIHICYTDCDWSVEVNRIDNNGNLIDGEPFAEGYDEDELGSVINDAWVHARAEGEGEIKEKYTLSTDAHLVAESIQEITLYAWPIIYGKGNPYDQDSRNVLETIRGWGEEFEQWWASHSEDWIAEHDYLEEVYLFTEKKCKEYLKELGVEPEPEKKPEPEVRGHIEETINVIIDIASIGEKRFAEEVCDRDLEKRLINEWAREFSKWYYIDLSPDEQMAKDYYEEVEAFVNRKLDERKEPEKKCWKVRIRRTEVYEDTVTTDAATEEEAVEKVSKDWGDSMRLYDQVISCGNDASTEFHPAGLATEEDQKNLFFVD